MKYVRSVLASDEKILGIAGFHWSYNLFLILILIIAGLPLAVIVGLGRFDQWYLIGAGLWALWFLFRFVKLVLERATTERVVTDRRLIVKTGIIARRTAELAHNRIEEINLKQSILGRILGYGDVLVSGTGGDDKIVFANIDEPVAFQRTINEARSQARAR